MESKIHIETRYCFSMFTEITLPDGKTQSDIEAVDVKWSTIFIRFKDGTEFQKEETDFDVESIDWKYPGEIVTYPDKNNEADYNNPIKDL